MKIIFKILLIIAIIIAVVLILALFVKKDYAVEREVIINKPKQQVFHYIKYLKNQNNYSKWAMMDPGMKKEYKGTDATPGFLYTWDGNKEVGKGEQTIKSITEGESIDFDLHFIKPFEGKADARMTTQTIAENQTKVKWGLKSKMMYPMNVMLLFMNMDKMIGNDLGTGLDRLKAVLEKQ